MVAFSAPPDMPESGEFVPGIYRKRRTGPQQHKGMIEEKKFAQREIMKREQKRRKRQSIDPNGRLDSQVGSGAQCTSPKHSIAA